MSDMPERIYAAETGRWTNTDLNLPDVPQVEYVRGDLVANKTPDNAEAFAAIEILEKYALMTRSSPRKKDAVAASWIIRNALSQRPQIPQEVIDGLMSALEIAIGYVALVADGQKFPIKKDRAIDDCQILSSALAKAEALQPYRVPQPPQVQE